MLLLDKFRKFSHASLFSLQMDILFILSALLSLLFKGVQRSRWLGRALQRLHEGGPLLLFCWPYSWTYRKCKIIDLFGFPLCGLLLC